MVKLQLLDIIRETLPDFDSGNAADLIKAEKVLKAHQKTHPELQLNDIENFLEFYREKGNQYGAILSDENLQKILKHEDFKIDSSQNRLFSEPPELSEDFGNDFSESIQLYIQINIKNNNWSNLRIFYKNYFPIINYENRDWLINSITEKNNLVRATIPHTQQYDYFLNQYQHAVNPDFYALQSDVDSAYFNPEIMDINNDLVDYQNTDPSHKFFLGTIFVALSHFDAYTEQLKTLLKKNARIGATWAKKDIKTQIKDIKIAEKDYGKIAEWILLTIFFMIVTAFVIFLHQVSNHFLWFFVIFESILFLILNKRLNNHFEKQSESKNERSIRRTLKKWSYKLLILQIYAFIIGACLAIAGGAIALIIFSGGTGVVPIILIILVIRRIIKARK